MSNLQNKTQMREGQKGKGVGFKSRFLCGSILI